MNAQRNSPRGGRLGGSGLVGQLLRGRRAPSGFWAIVSQACNSASNMTLALLVARSATPDDFGRWSIGYAVFTMVYVVIKATCSTPQLIMPAESASALLTRGLAGCAVMAGTVAAVAMVIVAAATGLWDHLLPFAVITPFIVPVDVVRSAAYRRRQAHRAAITDAVWLGLQAVTMGTLVVSGWASPAYLTWAWGLSGAVACALGLLLVDGVPSPGGIRHAVPLLRRLGTSLAADQLLITARTQATPVALAAVVGYAATGSLRASMTLMGFANAVVAALGPQGTLKMTDTLSAGRSLLRIHLQWGVLVGVVGALNMLVFLGLPTAAGEALLGQNWHAAQRTLIPVGLATALQGLVAGGSMALKARQDMKGLLRLRMLVEPLALGLPLAGVFVGGAAGAAWGMAAGGAVTAVIALATTRSGDRRHSHGHEWRESRDHG